MFQDIKPRSRTRIRKDLFVWALVLAVMVAIAVGDVGQQAVEVEAEGTELVFESEDAAVGGAIQTINFVKDMSVRDALRLLAGRYKRNIVPSANVDGVLSFTSLYDVTFAEAMDAILGPNFRYEEEGQLIKVYTKDEYKKIKSDTDRMTHRVFTLYYLTAKEAGALVKPVLSKSAVVQMSTAAEAEISAGGSTSGTGGSLGSGGGGDSLAMHDTIVVYDFPENIAKAEEVLNALDIRPKQVLVEATILSALLTEGMELGVDLNFMAGVSLTGSSQPFEVGGEIFTNETSPVAQLSQGVPGTPLETAGFANASLGGLRIGVTCGDFTAFITALESVTDTTILANPKVLAVNKQEGSVLIGQNLGYRSSTTVSTGGIATEGEVKFLQTGTQLVFRPYIGNDGYIRMDIYPKDSSATLNEDGVPTETTTQLRTNIVVKDGETIVIGGLFRDVINTTRSQVPLLGNLPLIGAAFRNTSDATQREEVIVLLTPHIIDRAGQTDGEDRDADIDRKRHGSRIALQGISRARLAEDHYINAVRHYADGNDVEALSELDDALDLRPTYLEALRLKERIIREESPDEFGQIERIMLGVVEREEAPNWRRR
ncbi:MAG: type II secretion system protein GspD [Planctomycetota bacterium]|jgi:type II secretory pathway component GspD/PulD (secretin)